MTLRDLGPQALVYKGTFLLSTTSIPDERYRRYELRQM
jgi:hypothetical protein